MEDGLEDVQGSPILTAMLASPKSVSEGAAFDVSLDCSVAADEGEELIEGANDGIGGSGHSRSLKRNAVDTYCSDDDDFNPAAAVALKSRRILFQGYFKKAIQM